MTLNLILLIAGLAICLGLLLGSTWTIQAQRPKLRRQAEERRRLNAEWVAVRAARQQLGRCPYCSLPLTDHDRYPEQAQREDPPGDE